MQYVPLQRKERRGHVQAGVQSLETGLALLRTLVDAAQPLKLKDIAGAAGMSASKAHRYMVSLCRSELVAQDADSSYRLGPYALDMSLACLNSLKPVKLASRALEAVGRDVGLTVAIAAWGNRGPTIVHIEESLHAVSMNVRAGAVVPLTRSAAGLVFAAFMPRHMVEPFLDAELESAAALKALEKTRAEVGQTGVASVRGMLVPGTDAVAVPIFDHRGALALALLAVGVSDSFSLAADGPVGTALKRHAAALSAQLGYHPAQERELRVGVKPE